MPNVHNFVFFGTPGVARRTLELLLEAGYRPALVVTNPDAPKGRGLVLTPSPTKELALAHGIPVFTPEKLDEAAEAHIREAGAAYALVVAYGKIFPESLIRAFPTGVLNVHYSLLPKYRGATPLEAALRAGDAVTGVTVQKMVRELDAGDMLATREEVIRPEDTARSLRPRLIELGAKLLIEHLPAFVSGTATFTPQDHAAATRSGKLKKEDGKLDLSAPALQNWNIYRAYDDTIGTHFFAADGTRVKIKEARSANGVFEPLLVVPEGKREMLYTEFLNSVRK